jgi:hypothetical protein
MGIGTQSESTLHRELKLLGGAYTGKTEVEFGGFVCDAYRDAAAIVEVQLGSFAPLARKIDALCETHRIVVVHPVVCRGSRHRNGASIADRRLAACHGSACLAGLSGYRRFIPFSPSEKWTAAALAQKAKIRRSFAQKAVYVLSRLALIQSTEKLGRARLWEWSSAFHSKV